ncbi:glycoside hydrolase family 28 protein, partial [Paenibacillus sepulcri]|nr:glycoside hydrolase family 28 protein [Paenibacillus sepulcri]
GTTFQNSPSWCLHPWLCEHVTIRGITVKNPWYSQNGDGLDLDSCRYVEIADSQFDVGDDAICIKSGKDADGRELGAPCENISIHDCTVYHGHGGFVIGSEMSG